jgi:hypothetical protein
MTISVITKYSFSGGAVMGDNDNEGSQLIEQQINQNAAEIEEKRQALSQERLDIIKSQGMPRWTPEPLATSISPQQTKINEEKQIRKQWTGGVA